MKRPEPGSTAIVLGASISGLLAARVLADYYSTVTIVERDVLPEQPVTRRGVPQGRLTVSRRPACRRPGQPDWQVAPQHSLGPSPRAKHPCR